MGAGKCGREVRTPGGLGGKGLTMIPVLSLRVPFLEGERSGGKSVPHLRAFDFWCCGERFPEGCMPSSGIAGSYGSSIPNLF